MNSQWQTFLQQQGAQLDGGRAAHFGDETGERQAARDGLVLCDLSHYGLIQARGDDTQTFLQGQFSNDVSAVSAAHSQLNSYNSPKGRAYAVFRLFKRDDAWVMRLPRDVLEPTLQRLRMFVLRAQVELGDASDNWVIAGLAGGQAADVLAAALGSAPDEIDAVVHDGGVTAIRVPGHVPRFELYGEPDAMAGLWARLAEQATPAGGPVWEWLEIQAGLPEVYAPTREAFVLQMINFQLVNGVSFTKGCYPGQEVVARMHYLGNLKKRMYLAHVDGHQAPALNDNLYAPESGNQQSVGQVVNAQAAPEGGYDLLAVVQIAVAEKHPVHLASPEGPTLAFRELPYPVTLEQ